MLVHGSFGLEVGKILGEPIPLLGFVESPDMNTDFILVATTHKRISALNSLDFLCNNHKKPWALTFLADSYLYCGPFFNPSSARGSGCFDCFYKRDLTHLEHTREPRREIAIDDYFNRHRDHEIPGFTAGTVRMASAFLENALNGFIKAGGLCRINLISGAIEDTEIIGVHDCPVCYAGGTSGSQREIEYINFSHKIQNLLK